MYSFFLPCPQCPLVDDYICERMVTLYDMLAIYPALLCIMWTLTIMVSTPIATVQLEPPPCLDPRFP